MYDQGYNDAMIQLGLDKTAAPINAAQLKTILSGGAKAVGRAAPINTKQLGAILGGGAKAVGRAAPVNMKQLGAMAGGAKEHVLRNRGAYGVGAGTLGGLTLAGIGAKDLSRFKNKEEGA